LLKALQHAMSAKAERAIFAAARALYLPWLRAAAELFQQLAAKTPLGGVGQQPMIEANVGECLLFADGLRYDLGALLRAQNRHDLAQEEFRWVHEQDPYYRDVARMLE